VTIADKIIHAGDTNTAIRFPAADTVTVETSGAERLRVDSSGNLGLGVTPSAWGSGFKAIQMTAGASFGSHPTVPLAFVNANTYFDGSANRYIQNGFASRFISDGNSGGFKWDIAPSGTAGNAITFTQAMTLDASGNLGVGTSSPASKLHMYGGTLRAESASASVPGIIAMGAGPDQGWLKFGTTGTDYYSIKGGSDYTGMLFFTAGSEAMRIDGSGNLLVGTTAGGGKLHVSGSTSDAVQMRITNTNRTDQYLTLAMFGSNGAGIPAWTDSVVIESVQLGTATGTKALYLSAYSGPMIFATNARNERMRIDSSGNLLVGSATAVPFAGTGSVGIQGSIGFKGGSASTYYYTIQANTTDFYIGPQNLSRFAALVGISSFSAWTFGSDRRIKHDIEDLNYGLEAVMQMQPRRYKFNEGGDESIGFIAQELKEVVPEAVTGEETPYSEDDTPQERAKKTMGVSKDTLIPVLVKAIQELTAKVASLEAQLNP
jgi:hypothetical protein